MYTMEAPSGGEYLNKSQGDMGSDASETGGVQRGSSRTNWKDCKNDKGCSKQIRVWSYKKWADVHCGGAWRRGVFKGKGTWGQKSPRRGGV